MKPKKDWPKTITVGSISLKVYRRKTLSGNVGFQLVYYDENGVRKFKSFSDETVALEQAKEMAKRILSHGVRVASVSKKQIAEFIVASDKLKLYGVSVEDMAFYLPHWLAEHKTLDNIEKALKLLANRETASRN